MGLGFLIAISMDLASTLPMRENFCITSLPFQMLNAPARRGSRVHYPALLLATPRYYNHIMHLRRECCDARFAITC
ncbi:hypothetical protein K505DRAFT_58311 [Melanomma pulvis-pyrius CBS 109.77]|uniref:Secreted protein n=1 Tax=Melanomma pulvis-pyrius CBS 109.77 TaxID=1314802 RepID=A0A6A6XT47_9PLEO|nr:hypothetical protein K505DRAFT_58311 [Melanomma pulvis-pyrius CBS 109.77]